MNYHSKIKEPLLILIQGTSLVGKSTLAKFLEHRINFSDQQH